MSPTFERSERNRGSTFSRTKLILIAIMALSACSDPVTTNTTTPGVSTSVINVPDGDSLLVEIDGIEEKVRLIGVNAPEREECFGNESAAALREMIDGAEITFVTDVETRDQYGRLLGYVYLGDTLINEEIARRGLVLARGYEPNTSLQDRIDAAADDARQNQRGMWAPTACASSAGSNIAVAEIEANPRGRDEDNLVGEWVIIANTGDSTIDLSGWTLRDASSVHRYVFPTGTTLAAGDHVTVFTGCGTDRSGQRYWCASGPVWDNLGDSVLLLDADGRIAATLSY